MGAATSGGAVKKWEQDGVTLLTGDVLDVLAKMEPESVDSVVTSPPYWSLRQYSGEQDRVWGGEPDCEHTFTVQTVQTGGKSEKQVSNAGSFTAERYTGTTRWQHNGATREDNPDAWERVELTHGFCPCGAWRGQYGLEPTPDLYVEHTIQILREIRRVLKPAGTVWWNIADSYAAGGNGSRDAERWPKQSRNNNGDRSTHTKKRSGLKPKDMCLIPQRVALAAQADGWWVRCDVIWAKPNPMPESVIDRPTKAHEYVWLLSKNERYYYDQDAVREQWQDHSLKRISTGWNGNNYRDYPDPKQHQNFDKYMGKSAEEIAALPGRNLRSVWTIPTQPSPLPHFAAFPEELAEKCIKAGTPPDGTVLDPFAGTGTTLIVARQLGRKAIGIEISEDYAALAKKRMSVGVKGVQQIDQGQQVLL